LVAVAGAAGGEGGGVGGEDGWGVRQAAS